MSCCHSPFTSTPCASYSGMRRRDQVREVADVLLERVDRDVHACLALVAVAEVAHPQRRRVRRHERAAVPLLEARGHLAPGEEGAAHRRRDPEQEQDHPPVTAVVPQEREVSVVDESLAAQLRGRHGLEHRPEPVREGVVEVHARDRLHHPPVAQAEADPVDVLHAADVRAAVARDRDLAVVPDPAGHAGRPQELVAEFAVDELVDVAQVLLQLPGSRERRGHELDQGFRVIRRDVRVGQCRAERPGVGRLRDPPVGRDPERLPLDPFQAAAKHAVLAGIHEPRQPAFEGAIEAVSPHGPAILRPLPN